MEQIIVQVRNKQKANMLVELLSALDFVNVVNIHEQEDEDRQISSQEESADFFAYAGLWANRDINLQSIRQQAWPRHT